VVTPDGVGVAVQDWATPASRGKRDVLLLHGFSQSHGCWMKQLTSALTDEFRLVTFDLRGHGDSDKPEDPHFYREPKRWADEVDAVIHHANLIKPVVIAWSYSGRVLLDYLHEHGADALSGLVLVNATTCTDAEVLGPAIAVLRQMSDPDPVVSLAGTKALLAACITQPLPADELAFMLAYNAIVPALVRANLRRPPLQYAAVLQALRLPTLVIHGALDQINLQAMATYTQRQVPTANLIVYEDAGHMPFWECPERFNRDVTGFIREIPA
jgi:non-heme chloroperoxidase